MKNRFCLHLTIDVIQKKNTIQNNPKHDTTNLVLVLEMELLEKLNRTLT